MAEKDQELRSCNNLQVEFSYLSLYECYYYQPLTTATSGILRINVSMMGTKPVVLLESTSCHLKETTPFSKPGVQLLARLIPLITDHNHLQLSSGFVSWHFAKLSVQQL